MHRSPLDRRLKELRAGRGIGNGRGCLALAYDIIYKAYKDLRPPIDLHINRISGMLAINHATPWDLTSKTNQFIPPYPLHLQHHLPQSSSASSHPFTSALTPNTTPTYTIPSLQYRSTAITNLRNRHYNDSTSLGTSKRSHNNSLGFPPST